MARRNKGNMNGGNRRIGQGMSDWLVSSLAVDNTGAVIATAPPITFGLTGASNVLLLPGNTSFSFLAAGFIPSPTGTGGTPGIGRFRISEVKGNVCFVPAGPTPTGVYHVAVAMYKAKRNAAGIWSVKNPLTNPADAQTDDYYQLEAREFGYYSNMVVQPNVMFELKLPAPIMIGGGEALAITVMLGPDSVATASVIASGNFRTRITQAV